MGVTKRPPGPPKREKLTEEKVHSYPLAQGGDFFVWDLAQPGFGVRIGKTRKVYVCQWKALDGKRKLVTIGNVGDWKFKEARQEAGELRKKGRKGGDPIAERRQLQERLEAGVTLADFFERTFLPNRDSIKATTRRFYKDTFNRYIKPELGDLRLEDITTAQVIKTLSEERVKANWSPKRKKPADDDPVISQRHACMRTLRTVLGHAEHLRFIPHNPCSGLRMKIPRERTDFLREDEISALLKEIDRQVEVWRAGKPKEVEGVDGRKAEPGISPHAAALFKLLLFTGARLNEIARAKWEWLDWEEKMIRLPDSKVGEARIILIQPAMDVLRDLYEQRTQDEWIIEGRDGRKPISGAGKCWRRVREKAGFPSLTIHGLRHSFASALAMKGVSLAAIGRLLNHSNIATTSRYAKFSTAALHETASTMAKIVEAASELKVEGVPVAKEAEAGE